MNANNWTADLAIYIRWQDRAYGPGGCTLNTISRTASHIYGTCANRPETLISGAPNRAPGTLIYWTANIDHAHKHVVIIAVEPDPSPGL